MWLGGLLRRLACEIDTLKGISSLWLALRGAVLIVVSLLNDCNQVKGICTMTSFNSVC